MLTSLGEPVPVGKNYEFFLFKQTKEFQSKSNFSVQFDIQTNGRSQFIGHRIALNYGQEGILGLLLSQKIDRYVKVTLINARAFTHHRQTLFVALFNCKKNYLFKVAMSVR